jgi:hypothetical protein
VQEWTVWCGLRGKQQRAGNDQGGNHSFHWPMLKHFLISRWKSERNRDWPIWKAPA